MWQNGADSLQGSFCTLFYFMHVNTLFSCISVHCVHAVPEEGIRCPGTNVIGDGSCCVGAGNQVESNSSPSKEWSVFLSADPSHNHTLFFPFQTVHWYVTHSSLGLAIILS